MFENVKFTNRLAFLTGAAAVLILTISLIYYAANNWFRINRIIIRGNISNVTYQDISNMVRNRLTGTFFTLDIEHIQKQLEQISWVKNVHVSRKFPDTININILEYTAIANLGNGKLLSAERLVFNGEDHDGTLPRFDVPVSQLANGLKVYNITNSFATEHKLLIKSMAYNGVGLTKLGFSNGMSVTICGDNVHSSLDILARYWEQLYKIESHIAVVNLCYKDALAIK